MTDNILSAVLTFGLLLSGSAAIGSKMVAPHHPSQAASATQVVMLPAVTVVGHRDADTQIVMLPAVTVTGHRDAVALAYESRSADLPRAQ